MFACVTSNNILGNEFNIIVYYIFKAFTDHTRHPRKKVQFNEEFEVCDSHLIKPSLDKQLPKIKYPIPSADNDCRKAIKGFEKQSKTSSFNDMAHKEHITKMDLIYQPPKRLKHCYNSIPDL